MRAKQKSHQILTWAIVGLAVVMNLAVPSAQAQVAEPSSSLCSPIWAKDASATLNEASFSDIMAVPGGNLWVVGSSSSRGVNYAIAEDKDASVWKSTPTHAPANSYFTAVSGISDKDVWAVGEHDISGHYGTLIEHWNGSMWTQISSPSERGFLSDVVALSARDAWAVGVAGTNTGYVSLIEHWDGKLWSVVPSPNGSANNWLNAISGRSGSSIWAVGWHGNAYNKTLIEYWDGVDWRIVPAPNAGSTYNVLRDVVDISPSDAWAVGDSGGSPYSTLTEHWNGSRWQVVSIPKPFSGETLLGQVAAMGPRDVWTVGQYGENQPKGFAENWDGSRWRIIRTPDGLGALTILPGGSVVSAGAITGGTGSPQAIVSQICPAVITDSSIAPVSIWDANWRTVAWFTNASNHSNHTIVDGTGMGLFNSGLMGPGAPYSFTFFSSGTYTVVEPSPLAKETVRVPVNVRPGSGSAITKFELQWASETAPFGYVYDVIVRRPNDARFIPFMTGTSRNSVSFTPSDGSGTYEFEARVRNLANGYTSAWSPPCPISIIP